jgi:hypothetical protein
MTDVSDSKNAYRYSCELCHFKCCKKSNFLKHLSTPKHKNTDKLLTNTDAKNAENAENAEVKRGFTCECGKEYKHRQSLFNHKKICNFEENTETPLDINDKDQLILFLIKQNSELIKEQGNIKQMMIEQQNIVLEIAKNGTTQNSHNTTHTNSHNKAFNLNFFLNETCKDAINITDFVDSIKLQLSDLEKVGELGYVEGISNIIVKNLKELDVTQRPVHCTDKKRETIYVKDENKWEKDDENKKMHKMVRKVTDKNFKMVQKFKEKYPDYNKASSRHSDTYNNIIIESMGGRGDNDFEKEERIIKKVSKEVVVEK